MKQLNTSRIAEFKLNFAKYYTKDKSFDIDM